MHRRRFGDLPSDAEPEFQVAHSCLEGSGAVAQLGERSVRNAEVEGSNPFRSTGIPRDLDVF